MQGAEPRELKAVILAAGKGTRMGTLTQDIPKPMIPVAGKPVVEHIMRRIAEAGVDEFVLVVGYLSEKIKSYFGDGSGFDFRVSYSEQWEGYGTGAALMAARELAADGPVLMTFADVITSVRTYKDALSTYSKRRGAGVVTLNWVEDPYTGAAVLIDEDQRICKIIEKPPKGEVPSRWNSAGIFVFEPVIFEYLERLTPSWRGEYELADVLNYMIGDRLPIYPSYLEGEWMDVGSVEAITAAEKLLAPRED